MRLLLRCADTSAANTCAWGGRGAGLGAPAVALTAHAQRGDIPAVRRLPAATCSSSSLESWPSARRARVSAAAAIGYSTDGVGARSPCVGPSVRRHMAAGAPPGCQLAPSRAPGPARAPWLASACSMRRARLCEPAAWTKDATEGRAPGLSMPLSGACDEGAVQQQACSLGGRRDKQQAWSGLVRGCGCHHQRQQCSTTARAAALEAARAAGEVPSRPQPQPRSPPATRRPRPWRAASSASHLLLLSCRRRLSPHLPVIPLLPPCLACSSADGCATACTNAQRSRALSAHAAAAAAASRAAGQWAAGTAGAARCAPGRLAGSWLASPGCAQEPAPLLASDPPA